MSLLQVRDLKVHYPLQSGVLGRKQRFVKAVDGVSFEIGEAETVGLVGESGCGKTTLGRAILRLIEPTSGMICFRGQDLLALSPREMRQKRRQMQIVFQDPYGSLDPRFTVSDIIGEAIDIHGLAANRQDRTNQVSQLLQAVGLDPAYARRYPHEFSGGQRQRIAIARALAVRPEFIVFDEPVSALDVSVQAQILNLLLDLRDQRRISSLFIAHDLAVVEHVSHRVMVMHAGRIVEEGRAEDITQRPRHPYTQALLAAVPGQSSARPG